MGQTVVKAVGEAPDLILVGGVDVPANAGREIAPGLRCRADLEATLRETQAQVMVDFTQPEAVMSNIRTALACGVAPVVGTTGLTEEEVAEVARLCEEHSVPAVIAPNFSLGAVLMMRFACEAAKYFDTAEIVELHHNRKKDAPSGTALRTAQLMREARGCDFRGPEVAETETLPSVRGGEVGGIRLHSVRLPGLMAHQEILFGGEGQILTLRHDSLTRESFIPGVLLAIRSVWNRPGLTYGLEQLLEA